MNFEWQPIESAPTEGFIILGGWQDNGAEHGHPYLWECAVAWYEGGQWMCEVDESGASMPVTMTKIDAWAPFPPPPTWAEAPPVSPAKVG